MSKSIGARVCAALAGAALVTGVASAAFAEESHGDDDVRVTVDVTPIGPEGALTMTVDGTEAALAEGDSGDPAVREYRGQLPTVTVTDTRPTEDIQTGAFWYVLGSATDFTGDAGQDPISAGHLGWTPAVTDPEGTGLVAPGAQVDTVLDEGPNNVGLVDQELLALAGDSQAAAGTWQADADLFLKMPATTAPGSYESVLTLSLFE